MFNTLVIGASEKTNRYSNMAVKKLLYNDIQVYALGRRKGNIEGVEIFDNQRPFEEIHTITLYLNPTHQKEWYDYILNANPKRVIFNPGTENPELAGLLDKNDISHENSCTLVMLSNGLYKL